uniref:DUF1684 domain-containing protein n=1 Tax=Flavobacterium sp. TaxID=239 RepID=UPI00404A52DE
MLPSYRISILIMTLVFFGKISAQDWNQDEVIAHQKEQNLEFADSTKSPLKAQDLKTFKGLDFYPINANLVVKATFKRTKKAKKFQMPTTTSRKPWYVKYGEFHFEIEGKKMTLAVYQNIDLSKKPGFEDYLFLPFTDLTSGVESYGGGRYIDVRIPKNKEYIIDFNKAYNPYCAYNEKYSCPIPPPENDLPIEILAGVKKFKK